jgi:type IV fimbrial biogenesis protein FimT
MQVLSRPRSVSLIVEPKLEDAGSRAPERGFDCIDASRHIRGFTLIELMIGIGVAAVLLVIAVPSFQNLTLSNRLTTAANDIVGAIYTARMEAIKLNASTQLCSDLAANNTTSALGTACTTQTGAVYALTGPAAATQIRAGTVGISTPLQLGGSGHMTALSFTTAGLGQLAGTTAPYTGTVVDICTAGMGNTNNHRVITMTAGSIITTAPGSGACP